MPLRWQRVYGSLTGFEQENVAVGVGDGERCTIFDGCDSFLMEEAAGLGEILCDECEAGIGADGGDGHDLYLLPRLSWQVQVHLIVGDGFEVELIDVEVAS